jgi:hypothetical protein
MALGATRGNVEVLIFRQGFVHCDHWADFGARNHPGFNEDSSLDAARTSAWKL